MKDNQVVKVKYVTVVTYRIKGSDEVFTKEFNGMTRPAINLVDLLRNHVDDKGKIVQLGSADYFHLTTKAIELGA